jgi:hypothetical protein
MVFVHSRLVQCRSQLPHQTAHHVCACVHGLQEGYGEHREGLPPHCAEAGLGVVAGAAFRRGRFVAVGASCPRVLAASCTHRAAQSAVPLAVSCGLVCTWRVAGVANPLDGPDAANLRKDLERSRNSDVRDLVVMGLGACSTSAVAVRAVGGSCFVCVATTGIHNAGMLRHDRNLTERLFAAGVIKVGSWMCCCCCRCCCGGRSECHHNSFTPLCESVRRSSCARRRWRGV